MFSVIFFFNDTATTEIYTLSLHDALPISAMSSANLVADAAEPPTLTRPRTSVPSMVKKRRRSEEHTSELQSRQYLVCRLLLEKKKQITATIRYTPYLSRYCLECWYIADRT